MRKSYLMLGLILAAVSLPLTQPVAAQEIGQEQRGIDRPGADIRDFAVRDWYACRSACANEPACRAWAYERPGVRFRNAHCWIKDRVTPAMRNGNIISGVKKSVRYD